MDTGTKPGYGRKIKQFLSRDLPPHLIIAHKALFLYVLVTYGGLIYTPFDGFPFLPFIPLLDVIPSIVYTALILLLFVSIFSSFLKIVNYRLLSLVSGFIILFLILSSKNFFSNSLTFVSCLLILIGFYREKDYLFRIQIALLYIGASTNKMIDPDWWNGNYFDFFFREIFDVNLYQAWVPDNSLALSKSFGIATVFTELCLGIAVLIPKITRPTIVIGMLFHASMLVITSGRLSNIFFYIMGAAFLVISRVDMQSIYLTHKNNILPRIISYLDPSDSIIVNNQHTNRFTLQSGDQTLTGLKAFTKLLLSKQVLSSAFFILFMLQMRTGFFVIYILHPLLSFVEKLVY